MIKRCALELRHCEEGKARRGNLLKDCFVAILLAVTFSVFIGGCDNQTKKPIENDYSVLNPQKDFTLHDQDGKIFHLKDHRGQLILLFFGYTTCPDVCPTTLSRLARVYKLLGPLGHKVLTVFVTIDPARDSALSLKEYLQYFSINALGLTGSKQEIDLVVDDYKASYHKVVTSSSALGYMFDHTDYLYLIDAQGKTFHLFHPDDKMVDMVKIIKECDHGQN